MLLLLIHVAFFVSSATARLFINNVTEVVPTANGPITGYIDTTSSVQIFKNIPFGADTATTRFKDPKPPTPWTEPRACVEYGNVAPQPYKLEITGRVQSEG
jgi:carboxylesterase type B